MKSLFTIFFILICTIANCQRKFDSVEIDKILLAYPKEKKSIDVNPDIIKTLEAIDRKYRIISDTLYEFKSKKHTIIQTVFIEINDSISINPLLFAHKLKSNSIIFENSHLTIIIKKIVKRLKKEEREKLYIYLTNNFHNYHETENYFSSQAVRIKYIKFLNQNFAQVGIDIYGNHFLWTINKKNWDVEKVEKLWVY